jgi:hypothetical protein
VPACQIPDLDRSIEAARDQDATVRRKGDEFDIIGVSAQRSELASARDLPQLDCADTAARGNHLAVRRECDTSNRISLEPAHLAGACNIPEPDDVIGTVCRQELPIRRKCKGVGGVREAAKGGQFAPSCDIPKLDGSVVTAGGEDAAIWRERDLENRPHMAAQRSQLSPAGNVYDFDALFDRAECKHTAVRRIGEREGGIVCAKGADFSPTAELPELDRVVCASGSQSTSVGRKGEGCDRLGMTDLREDFGRVLRLS